MPTTFCPKEDGDYLLLGQDHGENHKEIARHSQARRRRLRRVQPRRQQGPPGDQAADGRGAARLLQRRPRGAHPPRGARLALPEAGPEGPPRRDPAADRLGRGLPRRLLRVGHPQGLPGLDRDHRHEGRAVLAGLRASCCCTTSSASTTASSARGRSTSRATAGSPRSSPAPPRRSASRSSSSRRSTTSSPQDGRATGVALADGGEYHAPIVVSALDPRRTFLELVDPRELPTDLVEEIRRFRFQGTSAKVNFALDGIPRYPALGDRTDQYRGFTNIGPSMEYLERAFDDAKYGWYSKRPYLDSAIQSTVDPDMAPPGKAVMSCFVQYAPYQLRESDWDTERERPRRHRPGDARVVLPGLRRPRAPARGAHAARHRADRRPVRGQHLRRRVPRAADVVHAARRSAGRTTGPRSTATTSAARARTRAAA